AVLQDREGLVFVGTGTLIGTPMYRAGLDRGDRILSVDGKPVASSAEVQAIIAARRPGDSLPIEWEQRGETRRANLLLAEDPQLEVVTFEKAERPVSPAMQQLRSQWLASRASSTPSSRP
nr:PDZ domain-containing protein [Gemmatimonadota bacterium]